MPEALAPGARRRPIAWGLVAILAVQGLCALFFVWEIVASVFGLRREALSWQSRELLELGAAIGLVLGLGFGALLLLRTLERNRVVEGRLAAASAAFAEVLEARFAGWGLTPSERDVAWFTVKGLSIADIARLRETSEGTVKAQSNAIYRKAGVSSRAQLLSLFIEELMEGTPSRAAAADPGAPPPLAPLAGRAPRE